MKKFKSNFALLSALIGITGACIGTGIYAYTSANADKLELLNRAVANDTVNELQTTRSDIKIALSKGGGHSGAIINNQLYMWGDNQYGQLGLGNTDSKNTPTHVSFFDNLGTITQLSLGVSHSGAIINNQLYTWGSNKKGELGLGDSGSPSTDKKDPTLVPNMPSGTITQFALGYTHSGAIIDNKIYMWGANAFGQLGLGHTSSRNTPQHVTDNIPAGPITQLEMGYNFSGAVINNQLYMWGENYWSQLGLGNKDTKNTPTHVSFFDNLGTITQLALGGYHSGVVIDNKLYMWGGNSTGQLGLGHYGLKNTPQHVTDNIPAGPITQLEMGNDFSGAVINNQLYMWGRNDLGQLGLGDAYNDQENVAKPTFLNFPSKFIQLALGHSHSGVVIDNQLYIWGNNTSGQLGINNTTQQTSPVPVNSINTYDSSTPITLDATNDKDNLRDKMASNITSEHLIDLVQQSLDKFAINLPLDATKYEITKRVNSSVTINGINKEQISFDLTTPAYDQGNVTSTNTLSFSNVTIQGFTPFVEPEPPVEPPVEPDKPVEPIPPVEQPDQPIESPKNDNTWLIVGLSLGGVGLIGIIGTIFLIKRRHK